MRIAVGLVVAVLLGCGGQSVVTTDGPYRADANVAEDATQTDARAGDVAIDAGLDLAPQTDARTDTIPQADALQHDAQVDTATGPGALGQPCRLNAPRCDTGLGCDNGTCQPCGLKGQTCCDDGTGECWYTDAGIRICDTCPLEVDGGLLGRGVLGCSPYSHTCMDCGLVGKPCCYDPYGGGSWWCDGPSLICATDHTCRY